MLYDHGCNFHINAAATAVDLNLQIMLDALDKWKKMIGEKKENSSYNPFTNSIVGYIFFP